MYCIQLHLRCIVFVFVIDGAFVFTIVFYRVNFGRGIFLKPDPPPCIPLSTARYALHYMHYLHCLALPCITLYYLHYLHCLALPCVTLYYLHYRHCLALPCITLYYLHYLHYMALPALQLLWIELPALPCLALPRLPLHCTALSDGARYGSNIGLCTWHFFSSRVKTLTFWLLVSKEHIELQKRDVTDRGI